MRTPPTCRRRRSRAPPTRCARSRAAIPATMPRRRAAPTSSSTATTIRSAAPGFEAKVKLLETIDAYARAKDPRVRQVTASLGASWQVVEILRADGETYRDIRPLVRVNVSVVAGDGDRQESGSYGYGGREGYRALHRRQDLAARGRRGGAPGAGQSRSRCRRRPARWTWCSAPAGPASCCTRRSATASKATSTARRPRPSPA